MREGSVKRLYRVPKQEVLSRFDMVNLLCDGRIIHVRPITAHQNESGGR
jgi:hypothetical protein